MSELSWILVDCGYWGMLIAAFLAGSFVPFSSEAVMVGLLAAGLKSQPLIIYATVGNVLGAMLNYYIGRMGRMDWIEKFLHVKKEKIDKVQHALAGHGAWVAVFTFAPGIGEAISVALGLMRANVVITLTATTLGKLGRYIILMYGASFFI